MFWTVHLQGGPKRVNHAAVNVGHHIYSFGGYCRNINYEEVLPISIYCLNTATLRWEEITLDTEQMAYGPFQRYGHTAVQYGTEIIVWGGRNNLRACNKIFIFDTRRREWRSPKATGTYPTPRDGHSACIINDCMYIYGGFVDNENVFCNDLYYLDLKTFHWTKVNVVGNIRPPGKDFHTAPVIGSRMYIIGGRGLIVPAVNEQFSTLEKYSSSIYYFDTEAKTWVKPFLKGDIPPGRRSHSTFVYNGCIYMFGGCSGSVAKHFNDLHEFNPETNVWKEVKPLGTPPVARRRQTSVLVGDRVFIFGGSRPISKSEAVGFLPYELENQFFGLEDLDDLHVLELGTPKLRNLCIMKVIEEKLNTEWVPKHLRIDIENMTTPNSITS